MNDSRINDDMEMVAELLGLSGSELSGNIGVSPTELSRWRSGVVKISSESRESFYDFAYRQGIRLNRVKSQIFRDRYEVGSVYLLFHGSKRGISGELSLEKSRGGNDFGRGFYTGERFEQAAMFVSTFPRASVYCFALDTEGLKLSRFGVDTDWMISVAYYRGCIAEYEGHPELRRILERTKDADLIVAPIADNRMFELIDNFAGGELTDLQCRACLSATDLGLQYVLKTEKALNGLRPLENLYLCASEKREYLELSEAEAKVSRDKVRLARKTYRGQGRYIEEIFA